MTKFDQDGGNDDRRATPPADPWLETAPTSPIGQDGSYTVADLQGPVFEDRAPRRRDRRGWWVAVAVLALLGCVGGLLLKPFGDNDPPGRAGPTPQPTDSSPAPAPAVAPVSASARVAARPSASGEPAANEVVYLVSSTSKGDKARVSFTDEDRDIIRKGEVSLPWRHTFILTGDKPPLVVISQRKSGGTGEVTCSISLGGKVLSTAVQRGRYASPQCAG
ncbi:hypothetical protein [Actinoplanes solisilvae]|uniref:hypothetical protein n=1 Tax=Actinoplanes solisilvae TaxID=2486853 RepID=UPI000FDCC69F|nr:hypothetical protein [Actinoplanes solisilvae]